jgi:hypothetical protein
MNKQDKIDLIIAYEQGEPISEQTILFYELLENDEEFGELLYKYGQIDQMVEDFMAEKQPQMNNIPENDIPQNSDIQQQPITESTTTHNPQIQPQEKPKEETETQKQVPHTPDPTPKPTATPPKIGMSTIIAFSILIVLGVGIWYFLNTNNPKNKEIFVEKKEENIKKREDKSLPKDNDTIIQKQDNNIVKQEEKIQPKKQQDTIINNQQNQNNTEALAMIDKIIEKNTSKRRTKNTPDDLILLSPSKKQTITSDSLLVEWQIKDWKDDEKLEVQIVNQFDKPEYIFEITNKQKIFLAKSLKDDAYMLKIKTIEKKELVFITYFEVNRAKKAPLKPN